MHRSHPARFVSLLLAAALVTTVLAAQPRSESLTIEGLPGGPATLTGFSGSEGISQLFRFQLDMMPAAPRNSLDGLIGQELTVALTQRDGTTRHFSGICSRVSQGSSSDGVPFIRLELVPKLWLTTRSAGSRMFQDLTVPEIVERVLQSYGIQAEFLLQSTYPRRDCVTQYRESDFAFISRLMEEEGIFYFFRHQAGGHSLVISSPPATHPDIPGTSAIRFGNAQGRGTSIHEWQKTQELRSGKVTLRDHSFAHPDDPLEVGAVIQNSVAVGSVSHSLRAGGSAGFELYDYPGEYAQRFDGPSTGVAQILAEGQRTAQIRMQAEAVGAIAIRGASTHAALTSGHRFTLQNHVDADGAYILTSVQHAARVGQGGTIEYQNSFTCIPAGLPFRPERATELPLIAGAHPATVSGPAGAEVHTDGNFRVKVMFPWVREASSGEDASCWVRVATPSAETVHIPRIGDEVIVMFVEGDPDQPIIVGSLPNGR